MQGYIYCAFRSLTPLPLLLRYFFPTNNLFMLFSSVFLSLFSFFPPNCYYFFSQRPFPPPPPPTIVLCIIYIPVNIQKILSIASLLWTICPCYQQIGRCLLPNYSCIAVWPRSPISYSNLLHRIGQDFLEGQQHQPTVLIVFIDWGRQNWPDLNLTIRLLLVLFIM